LLCVWYILNITMKDTIIKTLKMHYGVTECIVYEETDQLQVMCVGGNVDFVNIALQQICDTSRVEVLKNVDSRCLFEVSF